MNFSFNISFSIIFIFKGWLLEWVEGVDSNYSSKIGIFGIKFDKFDKIFNWFSI